MASVMGSVAERVERRQVSWEALAALRFVLAWIVISGHLTWYSASQSTWPFVWNAFGGKAAVLGFLIVSGYSIAASLGRESHNFYKRRFLRIYPLYFFAIVFAVALERATGAHMLLPGNLNPIETIGSVGVVHGLENLFFLQTYFTRPIAYDFPVWSLALEVVYYAFAPLFQRMRQSVLLGLIFVSFCLYMLPKHSDWGLAYMVLSKTNVAMWLWPWLLGFLLWRDAGSKVVRATALLGVPATLFSEFSPEPLSIVTYGVAAGLVISAGQITLKGTIRQVCDYLGDVSYPLYIFHSPAMLFAWAILGIHSLLGLTAAGLTITILALHVIDRGLNRRWLAPIVLGKRRVPAVVVSPVPVEVRAAE
jgi:peptidoglycan/LPS O-acetylase OafA/YrhL